MDTSKQKVTGQRSSRWAFMSRMDIPSKKNFGEIYLSRLRLVQTPWFGVYIHHVNEADYDYDPHDHPWNFTSIILRGGYTERVWNHPAHPQLRDQSYLRRWNRWTWHRMTMEKAHRITKVDPRTISLILVGRRARQWGFWTKQGWVQWTDYEGILGSACRFDHDGKGDCERPFCKTCGPTRVNTEL